MDQLVDGDEEGQLAFPESVHQLSFVAADPKDRLTVGDELHLGEVVVHVTLATEVVPGASHPLQGHAVVEEAANHLQGNQVSK